MSPGAGVNGTEEVAVLFSWQQTREREVKGRRVGLVIQTSVIAKIQNPPGLATFAPVV